ncbi:hypothetical protein BDR03DRAFT_1044674 [Suillus americanus]|nr:hypothetical protein BDR03DRAFT_1044674 [Suillus americanus]
MQQQQAEQINREAQHARQLQQQQVERMNRQNQEALRQQQEEADRMDRQNQQALRQQQEGAEHMDRQNQDVQRAGQQVQENQDRHERRVREREERLEEALREYDDPASQERHDQDEERRRTQERQRRLDQEEEDQLLINQVIPIPDGGRPYTEPVPLHTLGPLDVECPSCHARHFACERLSKSSARNPLFGMCCLQGQVSLQPFPAWPPELQQAYANHTFRSKIRQYNSALAFTSVGVNIDRQALQASGPDAFRIHGSLHHLMGSLIPPDGLQPSYAQLYIYDPEEATDIRATRPGNEGLDRQILRSLHDMLYRTHPYAAVYKQAYQVMREKPPEEHTEVCAHIHFQQGTDGRRHNLPTADEIAAIIPGDGSEIVVDKRDLILRLQGGQLRRTSQLSHAYSTLHYVLIFPQGEEGWHDDIPMNVNEGGRARAKKGFWTRLRAQRG